MFWQDPKGSTTQLASPNPAYSAGFFLLSGDRSFPIIYFWFKE